MATLPDLSFLARDYDLDDLEDIIRERSFHTGVFTLASGEQSDHYFNLKPTMLDPMGSMLIGNRLARMAGDIAYQRDDSTDRVWISGMAVGAVPLIACMCMSDKGFIQGTFVRKQVKDHGTREDIEGLAPGETVVGRNIIVVEDVCTTGRSTLEAVAVLRQAGAIVTDAITVIERGGRAELLVEGITLHSLFHEDRFLGH